MKKWKGNSLFRIFTSSAVSSLTGIAFTLYNGFLGVYHSSIWNGTICVYYALLAVIRTVIVNAQRKKIFRGSLAKEDYQKQIYRATHFIIFVMNISLIVPITLMIRGDKSYTLGIIPAIAMATYTFYRIISSIIHYSKSKKAGNILVREIRTVNLIDSMAAVLTLQNALILANTGEIAGSMQILSIISSTAVWCIMLALSIVSFMYRTPKDI